MTQRQLHSKNTKEHEENEVRFVAFLASEYDKVFLASTLRTRTEMVFETLVFPLLNHLTQLIA